MQDISYVVSVFKSFLLQDPTSEGDYDRMMQSMRAWDISNDVSDLSQVVTSLKENLDKMKRYKVGKVHSTHLSTLKASRYQSHSVSKKHMVV